MKKKNKHGMHKMPGGAMMKDSKMRHRMKKGTGKKKQKMMMKEAKMRGYTR